MPAGFDPSRIPHPNAERTPLVGDEFTHTQAVARCREVVGLLRKDRLRGILGIWPERSGDWVGIGYFMLDQRRVLRLHTSSPRWESLATTSVGFPAGILVKVDNE